MLVNITRKLIAERRIILQRVFNDKNTLSTILKTVVPLHVRHASYICKPAGKQNHSVSSLSKHIVRHCTNLAIQDQEPLPNTILNNQISDKEVEKLLEVDWTSLSSTEFVSNFEKLSVYTYNNLDRKPEINYENFLEAFNVLMPNFVEEETAHVLKYLVLWFKNKNLPRNVSGYIIKSLDNECLKRCSKMSIESLFMFTHLFIRLKSAKKSIFTLKAVMKLSNKIKRMSSSQLTDFMILMSICKNPHVNLYNVEYQVEKNIKSFSISDLAKISIGFYKNITFIKSSNVLRHILETMLNNMDTISNNDISSFTKLLRLSCRPVHNVESLLREVLQNLEPRVPTLKLITLTYISELAAHVLIYEKGLMTSIFERFGQEIQNATMKDIERIGFSLTTFNYDSSYPLYSKIVDEINSPQRKQDIEDHRKSVAIILKYLTFVNIYPIKMLEEVMDPEYINKTFKNKYAMTDDYLYLDQNIEADVPNYTGPRLSDDLRTFLFQRFKLRGVSPKPIDEEILATCQRLLKTESGVFMDKVLPQYQSRDIIICLDDQNNLIQTESILSCMNPDSVKHIPEEAKKYKWFSITLGTKKMLFEDGHELITGITAAKCRQLKSLGYIPIVVWYYKWYDIKSSEASEKLQEDYIKSLLNNALPAQSLLLS